MMSAIAKLNQAKSSKYDVVSTDLFDTMLLRDFSTGRYRFDEAAWRAAEQLGMHPRRLSTIWRSFHSIAYKAVAAERPLGDASLEMICNTVAAAIGRGETAAKVLHDVQMETDIDHLSPNRELLSFYKRLAQSGKRIIAVTDTYYSARDIHYILTRVVGTNPISHIYASCDIGLTKHSGAVFVEVARREGVSPNKMVHIGDDLNADIVQARANGFDAIYLPRPVFWRRFGKLAVEISRARNRVNFQA